MPWQGPLDYRYPAIQYHAPSGILLYLSHGFSLDDDATPAGTEDIGLAAAKKAALRHAGVSAADAVFTKTERELDDGRLEYELDFYTDDAEYEYTVDGATGAVLDWEREAFRTAAADTDDRRGEDGHDANDPDDPDDDEDNDRDDRDEHDEDDD